MASSSAHLSPASSSSRRPCDDVGQPSSSTFQFTGHREHVRKKKSSPSPSFVPSAYFTRQSEDYAPSSSKRMTREDAAGELSELEFIAFQAVVQAFRAQGSLNSYKEVLLDHLQHALFISDHTSVKLMNDVVNDAFVTEISDVLNPSYACGATWARLCFPAHAPPPAPVFGGIRPPNALIPVGTHHMRVDLMDLATAKLCALPQKRYVPEALRRVLYDSERVSSRIPIGPEKPTIQELKEEAAYHLREAQLVERATRDPNGRKLFEVDEISFLERESRKKERAELRAAMEAKKKADEAKEGADQAAAVAIFEDLPSEEEQAEAERFLNLIGTPPPEEDPEENADNPAAIANAASVSVSNLVENGTIPSQQLDVKPSISTTVVSSESSSQSPALVVGQKIPQMKRRRIKKNFGEDMISVDIIRRGGKQNSVSNDLPAPSSSTESVATSSTVTVVNDAAETPVKPIKKRARKAMDPAEGCSRVQPFLFPAFKKDENEKKPFRGNPSKERKKPNSEAFVPLSSAEPRIVRPHQATFVRKPIPCATPFVMPPYQFPQLPLRMNGTHIANGLHPDGASPSKRPRMIFTDGSGKAVPPPERRYMFGPRGFRQPAVGVVTRPTINARGLRPVRPLVSHARPVGAVRIISGDPRSAVPRIRLPTVVPYNSSFPNPVMSNGVQYPQSTENGFSLSAPVPSTSALASATVVKNNPIVKILVPQPPLPPANNVSAAISLNPASISHIFCNGKLSDPPVAVSSAPAAESSSPQISTSPPVGQTMPIVSSVQEATMTSEAATAMVSSYCESAVHGDDDPVTAPNSSRPPSEDAPPPEQVIPEPAPSEEAATHIDDVVSNGHPTSAPDQESQAKN